MRRSKLNRVKAKDNREIRRFLGEAVRRSRAPGQSTLGTSGRGGTVISPDLTSTTLPTGDGTGTIHTFILGVDTLGDETALLKVQGKQKRYYG